MHRMRPGPWWTFFAPRSIQPPEVGWEELASGEVFVELELAWPDGRIGISLAPLPAPEKRRMQAGDWSLFSLEEAQDQIEELRSILNERCSA